MYFKLNK